MIPTRLDHLVMRTLENVTHVGNLWQLDFEGGDSVVISRVGKAKSFVGQRLTDVRLEGEKGRMYFGDSWLDVVKGKVWIIPANTGIFKKGQLTEEGIDPFFVEDVNADLPPDPSSDRISDGPTTPPEGENGNEVKEEVSEEAGATE